MTILQAKSKGLEFTIERSPQTPKYIYSDGVKLRQVLINILGNAIKFTKVGSVTLVVGCEESDNEIRLKFRVTDTGFGIAPNEIAGIFDSFNLMDMQMPEMDGLEATKRIRSQEKELNLVPLKIVAMTANVLKEDIDRCLASGMNDHLGKPILMADLRDCLERWIDPAALQAAIDMQTL
jgi:CheY-like chemotaxis protein